MSPRSFYQFIQTYADPYKLDQQTKFANIVVDDIGFPKHANDYQTVVDYVELTDLYSTFMATFDELWTVYKELHLVH